MNDNLKQKGWKSMQAMLDKELPAREKRRLFPFWFVILAVTSGFLLGFFIQNMTSDVVNTTIANVADVQAQDEDKPVNYQSENKVINAELPTENISNNEKQTVVQASNTTKQHRPQVYFSDFSASSYTKQSLATNALNKEYTIDENVRKDVKTEQAPLQPSADVQIPELISIMPLHLLSHLLFTTSKLSPTISIVKKPNLFAHQIKIEAGHSVTNPSSKSIALGYKFSYQKSDFYPFVSVGYRFVNYNVSTPYDTIHFTRPTNTVSFEDATNENYQFRLSSTHQLLTEIGMGKTFSNGVYCEASLRLPLSISGLSSRAEDALYAMEMNDPRLNANVRVHEIKNTSLDFQGHISIGKSLNDKWALETGFSYGFNKLNSLSLLNKKDMRYNQWTIGLTYKL